MNQSQQQQQSRKLQPCKRGCGTMITFANIGIGRTDKGGWRPLEIDVLGQLVAHDCKNFKAQSQEQQTAQQPPKEPEEKQAVPQTAVLSVDRLIATLAQNVSVLSDKIESMQKEIASLTEAIKALKTK